jgi:hypothetical protein
MKFCQVPKEVPKQVIKGVMRCATESARMNYKLNAKNRRAPPVPPTQRYIKNFEEIALQILMTIVFLLADAI